MAAFKATLTILQGETFEKVFTWKAGASVAPVDLTGSTARMQVRARVDDDAVLVELSTSNGRIVLGGTAGTITLKLSAAETSAFDWTLGVYDLVLTFADSTTRRLLAGNVKVSPEVTRG